MRMRQKMEKWRAAKRKLNKGINHRRNRNKNDFIDQKKGQVNDEMAARPGARRVQLVPTI